MRVPPYDTGKVKIGLAYEPPPPNYMTRDGERIQSALLGEGKPLDLPISPDLLYLLRSTAATIVLIVLVFLFTN